MCMAACAAMVDALRPALLLVACGSEGSKKPWLCWRARWPKGLLGMLGDGILIDPSTEVRKAGLEKFCKFEVLCDGVGPPAVEGLAPAGDRVG